MEQIAPMEARRFVVATGDAIAFNTVYRDRNVTWPILDLPFPLVFFCHRNPVDPEAGFAPENVAPSQQDNLNNPPTTGTEDLLLFADMVETLVLIGCQGNMMPAGADQLRQNLGQARWLTKEDHIGFGAGGENLFDEDGNRRSGTGEHVVFLRPDLKEAQIVPHARLEVWWRPRLPLGSRWLQRKVLSVDYEGYSSQGTGE
jgi:hypothetical protein